MRCLLRGFVGAVIALGLPAHALAQAWPSKSIRMVVNFAAGGSTDIIARSMAQSLAEALGQPIVVDNRVGASGNIGLEIVARAAPDGYTLLHSSDGPILINPNIMKMNVEVAKALVPIAGTDDNALFLIARPGIPSRNLGEFIAYARANPGKLNYGSAGAGTLQHVAIEMLMAEAKFKAVHVPYKGSQAVLVDLLAGQVDFTVDPGAAIPHIKSGKVRLLGVPTRKRSRLFPDAPTLLEQGTNVELTWVAGVYGPAGTPAAVVTRLNKEITRIMQTAEAKKQLDALASEALPPMTPQEFATHQSRARDRFGAVVRAANIQIN